MNNESKTLDVMIMGKTYRVTCAPDEEKDLLAAVDFVDNRMSEIREGGRTMAIERLAVMTALNIAHELISSKSGKGVASAEIKRKISLMRNTITEALADTQDSLF
ncbi:MAG: cell division protein ZapA [Pseudomonadota bacterium]|nr:cell division protein ZapA [Pseudomonadota bacterium]